jgi:predicted nucleotidyltransferase
MELKSLLDKKEYGFLTENPDLSNLIYLVRSGSYAYGTTTPDSDVDLRGVLIEPKPYLYGLRSFDQFEDLPTDTVIYGLKKFASLLTKANPNIIELLGVENDCIEMITMQGEMLRDNAELFLSKRVTSSFGNYALAQLYRLQNALYRGSFTEAQQLEHLQKKLNAHMEHFQLTYSNFKEGSIELFTDEKGLLFDINLKKYPVVDFVGIYSELASIVKNYNKLNHRNNKKSEAKLFKHAMHLIRLLMSGTDILLGKGITTRRKNEHSLLMDIRNGKLSFDEIFKLADDYQKKFNEAAKQTMLPNEPNSEAIDQLMIKIYESTL